MKRLSGRLTDVSEEQFLNAETPMDRSPSGKLTDVSEEQELNA